MSKQLMLTLIRGLPGSGKSTLAKKLVAEADSTFHGVKQKTLHLETDMYFVNASGDYCFQPELLTSAHKWCQSECEQALQQHCDVVVSNTFVQQWEMKAYRELAKKYHAQLEIKVCKGKYPSVHNVPMATIKRMKKDWQV